MEMNCNSELLIFFELSIRKNIQAIPMLLSYIKNFSQVYITFLFFDLHFDF